MNKSAKKFIFGLLLTIIGLVFIGTIFLSNNVFAQTVGANEVGLNEVGGAIGLPSTDIRIIIARIIRAALGLLGIVAVGLVIYGGYLWMTAGGNDEQIGKAKRVLINSVIGLVIIMSAYAITQFIFNRLISATTEIPAHCSDGLQNEGETGADCGGTCPACTGSACPTCAWNNSNVLYVDRLPPSGSACVRNVKPVVVFTQPVNLESVRNNLRVHLQSDLNSQAPGNWQYGRSKNIVVFEPTGDCGDSGADDCLSPTTDYVLRFLNNGLGITAENKPELRLSCNMTCNNARGCCGDVNFRTGENVDRVPPTVVITTPQAGDLLSNAVNTDIQIAYTDDNGIQGVTVYADGVNLGTQTVPGCSKDGAVNFSWPTNGIALGEHRLYTIGYDWAGGSDDDEQRVRFYPGHCFNNDRDQDETGLDCGGSCGGCGGDYCDQNDQCRSGFCDLTTHKCVDKMRITTFSPSGGAPGTYVSVDGFFFGENGGNVYFANKANPAVDNPSDWEEAPLVNCGSAFDSWTPWQILAEVPEVAVDGPIKVVTLPTLGGDGQTRIFTDTTDDDWGNRVINFDVNTQVLPGLCGLDPAHGSPGDPIDLVGKNFGVLNNPAEDYVQFGSLKAVVVPGDWANTLIEGVRVPGLSQGAVGIKVTVNGRASNSRRFDVDSGVGADWPVIIELSPNQEITRGGYLTIKGNNFGNSRGRVYFKRDDNGENIEGDQNSFPSGCISTWSNTEIVVKFPLGAGTNDRFYYVVVNNTSSNQEKISLVDDRYKLQLRSFAPPPGICHITPTAGPAAFPAGAPQIKIVGEYFLEGIESYAGLTDGRVDAEFEGPAQSRVGTRSITPANFNLVNGGLIETFPPQNVQTGPVTVRRMGQISNRITYRVQVCNNDDNCSAGDRCCMAGTQSGFCVTNADLCRGETRAGGYIWRFSNHEIVQSPRVVESCELNPPGLPSPSPSLMWNLVSQGDHNQVCRTSVVSVSINNLGTDVDTINASDVVVQECDMALEGNVCQNPRTVAVVDQGNHADVYTLITGSTAQEKVLQLHLESSYASSTGKWKNNTWYRVALKDSISTVRTVGTVGNFRTVTTNLAKDRPCSDVPNSAYCFVFKTGDEDCRLNAAVVTPGNYWTNVLEVPIRRHTLSGTFPLSYFATPLSDQECVAMNNAGINWDWWSQRTTKANIYNEVSGNREQQVSALGNTVGVGLTNPNDALKIFAQTSTTLPSGGTRNIFGSGILTIDTSRPEVIDYWPKCLETCTNANVAVRFNTTMSTRNLPYIPRDSVSLQQCFDENCNLLGANLAATSPSVFLDPQTGYTVLNIANAVNGATDLVTNTLYLVKISANVPPGANPAQFNDKHKVLWSAAVWGDPSLSGKPYAKEFSFRFRTKSESCLVDRIDIDPEKYIARDISEKTIFSAQPFSKPDNCSLTGQRLNAWDSGWRWNSSDLSVATVTSTFTRGRNPNCTASCIKKGSDVPAAPGVVILPVCGNGVIEAGEDCDRPNRAGNCGLDCLFINKTNTGSTAVPAATATSSSMCGNGMLGSGEDCDLGIAPNLSSTTTSAGCNERCLHTGTRISKKWCNENLLARGGFTLDEFQSACAVAYSQCGDGILSPDEDLGCDGAGGWNETLCNDRCLKISSSATHECTLGAEGCSSIGQHLGSSLDYSTPSFCGDDRDGIGEDVECEGNFLVSRSGFVPPFNLNPWALVSGVGEGNPAPGSNPPTQISIITGEAKENPKNATGRTVSGQGIYEIQCGYSNDSDCLVPGQGVGYNTCCYARPVKQSTYPVDGRTNVCANTYLEVKFDDRIDLNTLSGNLIIARGTTSTTCPSSTTDVTDSVRVASIDSTFESPWYKTWWRKIVVFVSKAFGSTVQASPSQMNRWCAGDDMGGAEVVVPDMTSSTSAVVVKLKKALAFNSDYAIVLKDGIRNQRGVSIGRNGANNHQWKFITGNQLCEIDKVEVRPDTSYLSRVGVTTTLFVYAGSSSGQMIQSVDGYAWQYLWGPKNNDVIAITSTTLDQNVVTAQNRNGEVDVVATAKITENDYSAQSGEVASDEGRVIVFLCENPWPPKDLYYNGNGPFNLFPFDDRPGNKDHYNLASNTFDYTDLQIASGGRSDTPYFNFSVYYCADNGVNGVVDDLPYLRPAIPTAFRGRCKLGGEGCNTDSECQGQARTDDKCEFNILKRLIFTNNKNSDAIGIQVMVNNKHLTAEQWFRADKEFGGQGFAGNLNKIKIDGYDAVTDGNNVYIDALNYDETPGNEKIFTNIYLFSINSDAREESRKVFSQLLNNLRFNINISPNKRFCGPNLTSVDYDKPCTSDLDCEAGNICANEVDKLKRNYERLRDLSDLELGLRSYAAKNDGKLPDLKAGTLLSGQSISTWESWSTLGNAIGFAAPTDPINRLGKAGTCSLDFGRHCTSDSQCASGQTCIIHDPLTGWSTEGRRFSFSCATSSLAYRYIFSEDDGYDLRVKFEDVSGSLIRWRDNLNRLLSEFVVDGSRISATDPNGICNGTGEIATQQAGRCGDGAVNYNLNERCDPPGSTDLTDEPCALPGGRVGVKRYTCAANCQSWSLMSNSCVDRAPELCGNGRVDAEVGEICDEGKELNGKTGHCASNCQSRNLTCGNGSLQSSSEVCDWSVGLPAGKTGWCAGSSKPGQACTNSTQCHEVWFPTTDGVCQQTKYSLVPPATPASTCNWDCQSFGPYCGDGIVQAEFGEECEVDASCSITNQSGKRKCTQCRLAGSTDLAWLNMDRKEWVNATTQRLVNSGGYNIGTISCSNGAGICPAPTTDSKFGKGAMLFDGVDDYFETGSVWNLTNFTLNLWVKPAVQTSFLGVLLEKGQESTTNTSGLKNGFRMQFVSSTNGIYLNLLICPASGNCTLIDDGGYLLPFNEWSMITVVRTNSGGGATKLYVNGVLKDTGTTSMGNTGSASNSKLIIGKSQWLSDAPSFKGTMDELHYFSRALSGDEISSLLQNSWFCKAEAPVVPTGPNTGSSSCGDGATDIQTEFCDNGAENGVACTPSYGQGCSYCSSDCSRFIDVRPTAFCGNGVIDSGSNEVCENVVDKIYVWNTTLTGVITPKNSEHNGYEAKRCEAESPVGLKRGDKFCNSNCELEQPNCITCGVSINENDPIITGSAIDVLRMQNNGWDLTGRVYLGDTPFEAYFLKNDNRYGLMTGVNTDDDGRLVTDPICSRLTDGYNIRLGNDTSQTHKIPLVVQASPPPGSYDLFLSPVIPRATKPNRVRLVMTWLTDGGSDDTAFDFGFSRTPDGSSSAISMTTNLPGGWPTYDSGASYNGIWWHGRKRGYNFVKYVTAYTVDTNSLSNGKYFFYVKSNDGVSIQTLRNTLLKVEVYIPENDTDTSHFARPTYTYNLSEAQGSMNPDAQFWQVLNINKGNFSETNTLQRVNEIKTGFQNFTF